MQMNIGDMTDRYTIFLLKKTRLPFNTELAAECDRFEQEVKERNVPPEFIERILAANTKIWDMESAIRNGKENELGLEEVGRRAIILRDYNRERVEAKNDLSRFYGEFAEPKVDHLSSSKN